MRLIIILLFITLSIAVNAQDYTNYKNAIGFSCFYSGSPTTIVSTFLELAEKKDYKVLKEKLFSEDSEEQFMAFLILNELTRSKRETLSVKENDQLIKIKSSEKKIVVCSGCTYFRESRIKDILNTDYQLLILSTKKWLEIN